MRKRPTTLLREMIQDKPYVRVMGAHNALTAKLAERAGFDAVWASGFEISTSHGVPDANILTMTEFLGASEEMAEMIRIPVISDCDTGYGNSNNVAHMVHKYEAAGIAAVSIEDKKFPKVNSFIPGRQELAPVAEFVGKIMAAKSAQSDPDFMIIARVEALISGWGQDEALTRARTYVDAGADAILIHSKHTDSSEIAEFLERFDRKVPIVVVPTTYYGTRGADLAELGVNVVIYANQGLRSATRAMEKVFAEIIEQDGTATIEDDIAPMKQLFEIQGMLEMKKQEAQFLRSDDEKVVGVIAAAGAHKVHESMEAIAKEVPVSALDISGKSLLERQVDILRTAGIKKTRVVLGYRADQVKVPGIESAINEEWEHTGNLASIFLGAEDVQAGALVMYGDILFEPELVHRLLRSAGPITLLVDRSFRTGQHREPGKAELVEFEDLPVEGRRFLSGNRCPAVRKVGRGLDPQTCHGEFAGIAYFTPEGLRQAREFYQARYAGKQSPEVRQAGLVQFLQDLIQEGVRVTAAEVTSGWTELHSLEDYRNACAHQLEADEA